MQKSRKSEQKRWESVGRGSALDVGKRGTDGGAGGTGAAGLDRWDLAKQKSEMMICLDRDSGRYMTGEFVKGSIVIALSQEVRVKDVTLKFFGAGRVSWHERRSYFKGSSTTVNLKNTDVFLDQTINIPWKAKIPRRSSSSTASTPETETDDSTLLPVGVHSFPFAYRLPGDLPASSYEGRWGQVKYSVKAVLQRSWKFDIEREQEITVTSALDLNEEPELARPIGGFGEFSPGSFCFRSGQVTVELRISRRGFTPGEKINFHVEIENNSRRKIYNHRVALIQHVTFRADTKSRKLTSCVCSLSRGEVLPGASSTWTKEFLSVPTVPPTSNKNYRSIQIKYTFSLFASHSSWADDFRLPVTVVIGTSGLKQETISHYLAMLGYTGNLGPPNPGGHQGQKPSPSPSRNASTTELSKSAINSSFGSSSKFLQRNSLTAPDSLAIVRHRSPSNGSLQLTRRMSRCINERGHASSTTAIHSSLDTIEEPREKRKRKLISSVASGAPSGKVVAD